MSHLRVYIEAAVDILQEESGGSENFLCLACSQGDNLP